MSTDTDWKELVARLEADIALRTQAQAGLGDEDAWNTAARLLINYGRALLRTDSVLRPEDVQDIVQEILVKLQTPGTMRKLRAARSPAGYVAVMMRNAAIDLVRLRQRERQLSHPFEESSSTKEEIAMEPTGRSVRLEQALRLLDPDERNLLRMRFWKKLSIAEISEALAISYSATAVRLFRILHRLRDEIEQK